MYWYSLKVKTYDELNPWNRLLEESKSILAAINALNLVSNNRDAWIPACMEGDEENYLGLLPVIDTNKLRQQYLLCLAKLKLVAHVHGLENSGTKSQSILPVANDLRPDEAITLCLNSGLYDTAASLAMAFKVPFTRLAGGIPKVQYQASVLHIQ